MSLTVKKNHVDNPRVRAFRRAKTAHTAQRLSQAMLFPLVMVGLASRFIFPAATAEVVYWVIMVGMPAAIIGTTLWKRYALNKARGTSPFPAGEVA